MKASIRVVKNNAKDKKLSVFLWLVHAKKRKKQLLFKTLPEYWDAVNETVLESHPNYKTIIPDLLNAKAKVKKVNFGNFKYNDAVRILFNKTDAQYGIFKNLVSPFFDDSTTGKLYKTVVNSFDAVYPNVRLDKITPQMAKVYMDALLKTNKPNGVHTYMRTLTALYNKVASGGNPFKGVRPKKERTLSKHLTDAELNLFFNTRTLKNKYDGRNKTHDAVNVYRYYFMLQFYLGGIDLVDLKSLRYDVHVKENRIQFRCFKGGTDAMVNNKIFPIAKALLDSFDCYPYLVPIYKYKDYNGFTRRMNKRLNYYAASLGINTKILTKSARYSFINRAQQLLIDERITMELVGHVQQSTHSIYTNEFPLVVRDEAHERIIQLSQFH